MTVLYLLLLVGFFDTADPDIRVLGPDGTQNIHDIGVQQGKIGSAGVHPPGKTSQLFRGRLQQQDIDPEICKEFFGN